MTGTREEGGLGTPFFTRERFHVELADVWMSLRKVGQAGPPLNFWDLCKTIGHFEVDL
jgi:hypothetical protein